MERFKQEFTSAAATLNGLLMFETCLALPPSNAKHGKALTLNRALKVFRTLGLIHADCKSFSAIPNTEYGTLKEAFVKCCLDSINLNAVSSAVLEGFVARKMAKVPQTVADKKFISSVLCATSSSLSSSAVDLGAGKIANRIALLAEAIADPDFAARWQNISEPEPAAAMPAI